MIKFRFRTFRKFWMTMVAVTSLTCIVLSISLNQHFNPKTDLCVLIVIPAACMLLSLSAILSKHIFTSKLPHCVAVECIWTACIVPFTLILGLFSYGVIPTLPDGVARGPFLAVQVFSWLLMALLALYASALVVLTVLIAAMIDKDIWFRDIAGSPSPFPISVLLESFRKTLMCGFFGFGLSADDEDQHGAHEHCLPGCSCDVKIAPPLSPPALPTIGFMTGSAGRMNRTSSGISVPVRIPTAMERHNSIVVGFDV